MLNTAFNTPHLLARLKAGKASKAPAEPQTINDIIAEHQSAVDKLDARIKQVGDPEWLADRKAKLEKQRATAQHEVDILHQAVAPKTA